MSTTTPFDVTDTDIAVGRDVARVDAYRDLAQACKDVAGLVAKGGKNTAQNYAFVGHAHVLEHCRFSLLANGIVIGAPRLSVLQPPYEYPAKGGNRALLVFSFTIPVFFKSGHVEEFDICATVQPNDKAAFVASTAADRTLRLRLCGLGGGDAEDPEHDTHDKAAEKGGW